MGMYGSRAVTLLVLISDDVINRILKLDIQTNILVYVTRCCTDLTSKVLKERTFCQSSALLQGHFKVHKEHSYSYRGLLLGSYRLGYVKFKDFQGPQGTLLQLSWIVTGLIQIRLCQIQRLFKDHK